MAGLKLGSPAVQAAIIGAVASVLLDNYLRARRTRA